MRPLEYNVFLNILRNPPGVGSKLSSICLDVRKKMNRIFRVELILCEVLK